VIQTIAIVGVGLIGGSFALAVRKAGFAGRIIGVSSAPAAAEALELGIVDEVLSLEDAVRRSDLVYISRTIRGILSALQEIDPWLKPGALVTDAGSTKTAIMSAAAAHIHRAQFLGGHPMAGKEVRGAAASDACLFAGRTYVLTPAVPTDLESASAREFSGWLDRIGARVVPMQADLHDRVVAFTSHLPQLASTALAAAVGQAIPAEQRNRVAGSGLIDSTRLALSSFDIWGDILETNTALVREALGIYIEKLVEFRGALTSPEMARSFREAAEIAAGLRSTKP
jgi:prephenate dehydrogenase